MGHPLSIRRVIGEGPYKFITNYKNKGFKHTHTDTHERAHVCTNHPVTVLSYSGLVEL